MGLNKIALLGVPTLDTDASTKKYVDDSIVSAYQNPLTEWVGKLTNKVITPNIWVECAASEVQIKLGTSGEILSLLSTIANEASYVVVTGGSHGFRVNNVLKFSVDGSTNRMIGQAFEMKEAGGSVEILTIPNI